MNLSTLDRFKAVAIRMAANVLLFEAAMLVTVVAIIIGEKIADLPIEEQGNFGELVVGGLLVFSGVCFPTLVLYLLLVSLLAGALPSPWSRISAVLLAPVAYFPLFGDDQPSRLYALLSVLGPSLLYGALVRLPKPRRRQVTR